jgi:hypothetical protein
MALTNNLGWAVVATCTAKNNGVNENFQKIIATFDYPYLAQDFINKCLPEETKEKFQVVSI